MSPPSAARIEHFERVPAEFAQYVVDVDAAAKLLGLSPEQTAELAPDALPHTADPERGPLFDYVDLMNLALFAGTSRDSIPELALRFLLRFAAGARPTWYEPRHWLVRVRAPRAEDDEASKDLRLLRPDVSAPGVDELDPRDLPIAAAAKASVEPPGYEVVVRLTGAEETVLETEVRSIYDGLLDTVRSGTVVYQSVSEELRMQHERAWDLGMADCVVISRLLAQKLREAGYRARARRGYLLGLVGSDHAWCEYFEDGRWKTLDIVFAFLAGGEPAPPWALAGVSATTWES